ncbi:MAG: sulfite oxidase-like oxidoreductase [Dehalococcoidia bacterium]
MAFDLLSRRSKDRDKYGDRLPPGQKVVQDWPVLTYGGTPNIDLKGWRFRVSGAVDREVEFTWDEFTALPSATVKCDIHCVTSWSRFDNEFEGVPFQELLKHFQPLPEAGAVMVHSYGGYTTNVLLSDLTQPNVMLAYNHDGKPLTPTHGGPLRLLVPHLYFWKSAKWARGLEFIEKDRPGFWEMYGYHMRGDPWKSERYS